MRRLLKYTLATFLVGIALPTAASLFIHGGVGQLASGFPFTLGTTTVAALSTVTNLLGLTGLSSNGISTASTTDPIIDYHCAGIATTTTGTITSGTNSLVVASATGWTTGMGIAIANAGTGGTTELITTISAISGTTFTLGNNAITTATTQTVNHDDTTCLQNAVNSGKNMHLRLGTYNITSRIDITAPMMFTCEGGAVDPSEYSGGYLSSAARTSIQNRGTTNDWFKISSNFVSVRDCGFHQATGITPTAGYVIDIEHATKYITGIIIERNTFIDFYGWLDIGGSGNGHALSNTIQNNYAWTPLIPTNGAVYVNNPAPAGDNRFRGNELKVFNGLALNIVDADINPYTDNKFNECSQTYGCIKISGTAHGQSFQGNSIEGWTTGTTGVTITAGDTITFVGGECGVMATCFAFSGTASGAIVGVNYSAVTGAAVTNSGSGIVRQTGNYSTLSGTSASAFSSPADTAPDGTASVNCTSGISATTGRAKGGIITAC